MTSPCAVPGHHHSVAAPHTRHARLRLRLNTVDLLYSRPVTFLQFLSFSVMTKSTGTDLLMRARAGDQAALGELLKGQNQLLEKMAQKEVAGRLQARLSAADIVQQTCLSAIRSFDDFRGDNEPQFAAWLRGVHERNVKDIVRQHVLAQKRAVSAQQPLNEELPHGQSLRTPSRRVMLDESAARLMQALRTLPEAQAEAVRLRHLEQLSLNEIAEQMGRTDVAVASLLKRGLAALREHLPAESEEI